MRSNELNLSKKQLEFMAKPEVRAEIEAVAKSMNVEPSFMMKALILKVGENHEIYGRYNQNESRRKIP